MKSFVLCLIIGCVSLFAIPTVVEDINNEVVENKEVYADKIEIENVELSISEVNAVEKVEEVIDTKLHINTNNMVCVGNSLVQGLKSIAKDNNVFYCKVGENLYGLNKKVSGQLVNHSCETVVIGMGTNELGWFTQSQFEEQYGILVRKIREINPNSNIVVLSIPPVSQYKSNNSSAYNNVNVRKSNEYIKKICEDNALLYVDCSEYFGDVLRSDWTGDGMHLNGNAYIGWYNFIKEKISEF